MKVKQLIEQINEVRKQRHQLQLQDKQLKAQLDALETQLKSLAEETGQDFSKLSEEEFQMVLAELGDAKRITIEVVYAQCEKQIINELQVPQGATIEDGIVLSGILDQAAEVDLTTNKVGIFGVVKPLSQVLADGDRVEIYRGVNAP